MKGYAGKDVNELFIEHAKLAKTVKERGIIIPTKDSPAEEVDEFHSRMGIPKTAEGYQLKAEALPKEAVEAARAFVNANGYTQKQAQAYVSNLDLIAKAGRDANATRRTEGEKNLKANLVQAHGGDEKAADASYNLAVKKMAGFSESTREKLLNTGLAYDPQFLKEIAADQARVEPHKLVVGEGGTTERGEEPRGQGKFGKGGYGDAWNQLHGRKGA